MHVNAIRVIINKLCYSKLVKLHICTYVVYFCRSVYNYIEIVISVALHNFRRFMFAKRVACIE